MTRNVQSYLPRVGNDAGLSISPVGWEEGAVYASMHAQAFRVAALAHPIETVRSTFKTNPPATYLPLLRPFVCGASPLPPESSGLTRESAHYKLQPMRDHAYLGLGRIFLPDRFVYVTGGVALCTPHLLPGL